MYKCTECGQEYKVKPEYCDCGNNEFVITISEETNSQNEIVPEKQEPQPDNRVHTEETNSVNQNNFNTLDKTTYIPKRNIDIISLTIFLLCIILSILIIFVWKVKENPVISDNSSDVTKEQITNLPSIDKLWKENSIKQEVEQQITNNKEPQTSVASRQESKAPVKTVQKVNIQKSKLTTSKTKAKANKNRTVSPSGLKTTSTAKTNGATAQNAKEQQEKAMKQAQENKEKAEAAKKAQEAKIKAEAEAYAAANAAKKAAVNKQEYETYKISLRNTIAKKIDFTKVIGDGSCIITFKLKSTGELTNRNFAQQSQNITLNNAVYKAIISTPSYNPPPSGYNNQTLRLNISFKNGNFEISLTD